VKLDFPVLIFGVLAFLIVEGGISKDDIGQSVDESANSLKAFRSSRLTCALLSDPDSPRIHQHEGQNEA
jgi:hypothetical protein